MEAAAVVWIYNKIWLKGAMTAMKNVIRARIGGLTRSVVRFPVAFGFLLAAAALTSVAIATDVTLHRWILACAVGAAAGAVSQAVYERFFEGAVWRKMLMSCAVAVALLYYLSIRAVADNSAELLIHPAVTLFALFIAFVWAGVIRSRVGFDESFMAAFKALFQAVFFSGILFLGCAAIIAATDRLIAPINGDAYLYTASIVFIIVAPMILLSLIPVYPGKAAHASDEGVSDAQRADIEKRTGCPKFLEVLLSYIIIPLITVFTAVLLVYILLNIGGKFWTDNLLEPLLISYSIAGITATLLAARLNNRFAMLFHRVFPKVLIPIALFQVAASVLNMAETGVTYGRYYVILYGVFAVLSGVFLSFLPLRKSGVIALLLVVLSAVSLIPPVDAFTVSRASQIYTLEQTLVRNGMLSGGIVTPDGGIPEADKTKIINAVRNLADTDDLDAVPWLPDNFNGGDDEAFYKTFGFHMYGTPAKPGYEYVSVYLDAAVVVPVAGYDYMARITLPYMETTGADGRRFTVDGITYQLTAEDNPGGQTLIVRDDAGREMFRYNTAEIFRRYEAYGPDKSILTLEEAAIEVNSSVADVKIIVMSASFSIEPQITNPYADLLVLIKLK
jgi:hypothetical protein